MISCGLPDGGLAAFDLGDQLTFEFGFELSTNFSHYEYRSPRPLAEIGGREGLWKMPQLWKSEIGDLRQLLFDGFPQADLEKAFGFSTFPQAQPRVNPQGNRRI